MKWLNKFWLGRNVAVFCVGTAAQQGKTGLSEVVPNFSPDHAAILIEHLFEFAQCEMEILTGYLNSEVYGQEIVVQAANAFIQRPNTNLRILVEKPDKLNILDHPMLGSLPIDAWRRINLREVPVAIQAQYRFHFAIADRSAYRVEGDREAYEASGRFGDIKTASILLQRFESIWELSKELVVPSANN
jgi:hypothetical protein